MTTTVHHLPFGLFQFSEGHMLTICIHNEVEINKEMGQQMIDLINTFIKTPGGIIIDQINDYSYTFDALRLMVDKNLPQVIATALVVHHKDSRASAEYLVNIGHTLGRTNMKIFDTIAAARAWVSQSVANLPTH